MVSPVVPLFRTPLLMPAPGLGRSVRLGPPAGFAVAGETAASPDRVVEPVLAFSASASELIKTSADTAAINAFFMADFPHSVASGAADYAGGGACVSGQVGTTP
jgi:hypothetical protein